MIDAQAYLDYLDRITERPETKISEVSSTSELPNVYVFHYKDWPEQGYTSSFTFGLSVLSHPEWLADQRA